MLWSESCTVHPVTRQGSWSPRSPDLYPGNVFLWTVLQNRVHSRANINLMYCSTTVGTETLQMAVGMLHSVMRNRPDCRVMCDAVKEIPLPRLSVFLFLSLSLSVCLYLSLSLSLSLSRYDIYIYIYSRVKHFLLFNIYVVYVSIYICVCGCVYVCVYIHTHTHTHTCVCSQYGYIYHVDIEQ